MHLAWGGEEQEEEDAVQAEGRKEAEAYEREEAEAQEEAEAEVYGSRILTRILSNVQ